jgi:cytochrome c553
MRAAMWLGLSVLALVIVSLTGHQGLRLLAQSEGPSAAWAKSACATCHGK